MNQEDKIAEEDGSGKVTESSNDQTTQTSENTQDTIVIDPESQVET